jgi:nitroreductase
MLMDFLEIIHTRRSIRKFTGTPVSDADTETLLRAAMAAPTAINRQSWRFVVIDDRQLLDDIPRIHPYASMAKTAPLAVLVCGETEQSKDYWPLDCAAAIENMLLTARALGLGSVWCAIHPIEERERAFSAQYGLPAAVRPMGIVFLGHPAQPFKREERYDPAKIHHNRW